MHEFELKRRLRGLLGGPAQLGPDHARALEGELLARFDHLYPEGKVIPMRRLWMRKVIVAAAAAALLGAAACVVPADMDVVVGHRVVVRVPEGVAMPDPGAVADVVRGGGQRAMARLEQGNGASTLTLEVWGDEQPEANVAARIRTAFPALASADIRDEALEGTVRGTFGKKLGRELLDMDLVDKSDVETARRQVMAQLAAQGIKGKVDVQVDGDGNRQRVKVRVEREEPAAGEDESKP